MGGAIVEVASEAASVLGAAWDAMILMAGADADTPADDAAAALSPTLDCAATVYPPKLHPAVGTAAAAGAGLDTATACVPATAAPLVAASVVVDGAKDAAVVAAAFAAGCAATVYPPKLHPAVDTV